MAFLMPHLTVVIVMFAVISIKYKSLFPTLITMSIKEECFKLIRQLESVVISLTAALQNLEVTDPNDPDLRIHCNNS